MDPTNAGGLRSTRWKGDKRNPYSNHRVLLEGEPVTFDVYSEEGRSRLEPKYVYWLELHDKTKVAVLNIGDDFKAISLHLCQCIWPNIKTREVGANERVLEDGTVCPVIPVNFWKYKLHNQEKSRASRDRKRKRPTRSQYRTSGDTKREFQLVKEHFNLFEDFDAYASVIYLPPGLFSAVQNRVGRRKRAKTGVYIWDLLRLEQDERSSFENPFKDIRTREDLRAHPQHELMVNIFHCFFPVT